MGHTFKSGLRLVRGKPILVSILSIGLIYGLYSEGFDRLWTAHLLQDISLPAIGHLAPVTWFGLIRAVSMILGIVVTEFARRRISTENHSAVARALFGLNTAMVIGLLTFALTGNFVVALIAYWAIGSSRQTVGPMYTAWVNQHVESSVRATVISMSSQIDAFGQILGGPIVGAIGLALGIPVALTISATILAMALPLLIRTIRVDRREEVAINEVVVAE
jgi:DHA3 family tetracycline resistance protein-like MFS transporter